MERQDTENLFRRYKGELVVIKTVSGATYSGRVTEITNDYVCLTEQTEGKREEIIVFLHALETFSTLTVSDPGAEKTPH
jgi:ribosome maturation factor RimP